MEKKQCWSCGVQQLELQIALDDLKVKNERLEIEVTKLRRVVNLQKRDRNRLEIAKQSKFNFG